MVQFCDKYHSSVPKLSLVINGLDLNELQLEKMLG